jgi:hypothetical protein
METRGKELPVNRSFHLPSLLDGIGNRHRKSSLVAEVQTAIGPLFNAVDPQLLDSTERNLVKEFRAELRSAELHTSRLMAEAQIANRYLKWKASYPRTSGRTRDKLVRASSILIQAVLNDLGLDWPQGVFQPDLFGPGSGPKGGVEGVRAANLYDSRDTIGPKLTSRKIAERVFPAEYEQDKTDTTKKTEKAMRPFLRKPPEVPVGGRTPRKT